MFRSQTTTHQMQPVNCRAHYVPQWGCLYLHCGRFCFGHSLIFTETNSSVLEYRETRIPRVRCIDRKNTPAPTQYQSAAHTSTYAAWVDVKLTAFCANRCWPVCEQRDGLRCRCWPMHGPRRILGMQLLVWVFPIKWLASLWRYGKVVVIS